MSQVALGLAGNALDELRGRRIGGEIGDLQVAQLFDGVEGRADARRRHRRLSDHQPLQRQCSRSVVAVVDEAARLQFA
jgi:hypothetical protein